MGARNEDRKQFLKEAARRYDELIGRAGKAGETFDDIEQDAEQMGRELIGELLTARLAAEAEREAQTIRCPGCGRPMRRVKRAAPRHLDTASGPVRYQRRHAICDRCGASFSPSGPSAEDPAPGRIEPPASQGVRGQSGGIFREGGPAP